MRCLTTTITSQGNKERHHKHIVFFCFFKSVLPPLVRAESGAVLTARQAGTTLVNLLHQNPLKQKEEEDNNITI